MKYSIVFPGQGSQSLGMLSDLANNFSLVKRTFEQASDVLGFDLWQITQQDQDKLNQTQNTQPAMLAAGFATYQVLSSELDLTPKFLAGHSLGEYTALVASGCLDFSDTVSLVQKRAQLMQSAVKEGDGAMAAVLGLADEKVVELCSSISDGVVEAVNFNSPGQVVIAGDKSSVLAACELMKENGAKRALVLPVSVPSHCSLMDGAAAEFATVVNNTTFKTGKIPVVHNVNYATEDNANNIGKHLINQLNHSVQWTKSVQFMGDSGVDTLIECGPGKVLAGLTKRIDKTLTGLPIFDSASLEKTLGEIKNAR